MKSRLLQTALTSGLALAAFLGLVAPAEAVIPGENGRIVLISGRTAGDANAEPFLLPVPSSTGGGTLSAPVTTGGGQHRHPTWSPDRTKIAYARGTAGNFDIFVLDLTTPGAAPQNITNSNNITDDRPSWSPDGTSIAYESEVADGSNQTDVMIRNADGTGTPTNLTNTAAPTFEGKPVWSPTAQEIYYHKAASDPMAATNASIVKRPATGGAETLAIADGPNNEFQPSISPDGERMCFTHSVGGFNGSANVHVALLTTPPSTGVDISDDIVLGDYNCTWSPDGRFVAYVNGIFGTGKLVMTRSNGSDLFPIDLAQDPGGNDFDGNPEWAPDGRPLCDDQAVETTTDTPVTFTVECVDTGPEYERSNVREFSETQPTTGTLEQELAGDPFTYTPPAGFTGTTEFQVSSFDELGFGSDEGTVTINVRTPPEEPPVDAKCAGKTATITGTDGKDKLKGTSGNDVIAALAGNDQVKGGKGNDLICGAKGKDKLKGGPGKDKLKGGPDKDNCNGGGGRDKAGCEIEKNVP